MSHAIFVHRYAIRHNLVLVDQVSTHGRVCDLFVSLQHIQNLVSTRVVPSRFVAIIIEHHSGHQKHAIPRIFKVQYRALFTLYVTLDAVIIDVTHSVQSLRKKVGTAGLSPATYNKSSHLTS